MIEYVQDNYLVILYLLSWPVTGYVSFRFSDVHRVNAGRLHIEDALDNAWWCSFLPPLGWLAIRGSDLMFEIEEGGYAPPRARNRFERIVWGLK